MDAFRKYFALFIILGVIAGLYIQHNIGMSDEGDFIRGMTWFTSGPIGIEPNWPDPITHPEDWNKRFFNYWLPDWKLDFPGYGAMNSSTILLWLPGVFLNYFLISPTVLFIQNISLFPKFVLIICLLLVFKWVETLKTNQLTKVILSLTLGVPLGLMFVANNYISYMNSFYYETGSFIYLFIFLISLVSLDNHKIAKFIIGLLALLLLSSAKPNNLYWPIIAIPFLLFSCGIHKRIKPVYLGLVYLCLAIMMTATSYAITKQEQILDAYNNYDRLFFGVLTFSNNPSQRLSELKLNDLQDCIGKSAFEGAGVACFNRYAARASVLQAPEVILREPTIIIGLTRYVSKNMQNINITYLQKPSIYDPNQGKISKNSILNLWSTIKIDYFPKGKWLLLTLVLYMALFIFCVIGKHWHGFAQVGLLTTVATIVNMYVVILGDGNQDIAKHLFLSNVTFDIATILFVSIAITYGAQIIQEKFKNAQTASGSGITRPDGNIIKA